MSNLYKRPLFVFELANNHMGSLEHGLKVIRTFAPIVKEFPEFQFAFKFQFRNLDSFIHPHFKTRMDIKYVKRFSETKLSEKDFSELRKELDKNEFLPICTPFDEESVNLIEKLDFKVLKIASCSFTDWPLLERIAKVPEKPIIASTASATFDEIDKVVSFFVHRQKSLSLMHCVLLYGELSLTLNGKTQKLRPGNVVVVEKGTMHAFSSKTGAIIEEISSTHFKDDSYYTDPQIAMNRNRKTVLTYWMD